MKINLEFEFTCGQTWPQLIFLNSQILSSDIVYQNDNHMVIHYTVETNDPCLRIRNSAKNESDTIVENNAIVKDQTVKLLNMWINDILIDLNVVVDSMSWRPEYSKGFIDHCQQQNITPPDTTKELHWFFNGVFIFIFELPFWQWYARQKQMHVVKYFSTEDANLYLGFDQEETQRLLLELKKLLDV